MTTPTDGESDAEWLSAAEVIAFLPHRMRAICKHARAGLVRTRAKLFIDTGRRDSDCEIPADFWWAEGGDALEQDWVTGHFRTTIFGRTDIRVEAFGVQFRRSEIEQLKPQSTAPNAAAASPSRTPAQQKVFIGHGHSSEWLKLKNFLNERLHLNVEEFNSTSAAGVSTTERLNEMLEAAGFAFLVLTGEDEQATGKFNPRLNVIHEAGLFQGKLGFKKAIILKEEGCEDFSNVHGLTDIRFPKGKIDAAFEQVRGVLEREKLIYRAAVVERDSATQHADAVGQKLKPNHVKDLLGKALDTGKTIFVASDLTEEQRKQKATEWGTHTRDLIAAACGDGEAFLLLDDSGYTFFSDSANPETGMIRNWIDGRMRRIGELLRRIDSLTVRSDFEPAKFD
jgi:predicted nucleotide-binding protein